MKKPFGYIIAFAVQYTAMWYVHCNIACMISLAFGSFLVSMSVIKNIKNNIYSINKNVKSKENRLQTFKKISNFIDFHATLKQLSKIFGNFAKNWFTFNFNFFLELFVGFRIFINRLSFHYLFGRILRSVAQCFCFNMA